MIDTILNWIDKKKAGTNWDLFQLATATLTVVTIAVWIASLIDKVMK